MAHRILVKVVFNGAKAFGAAFTQAYKQAASANASQRASGQAATAASYGGIQLDEACKILDVNPKSPDFDMDALKSKYDYLFNVNSKEKGGSFYLQSKIYFAKERIAGELKYKELQKQKQSQNQNQSGTGSGAGTS